MTFGGKANSTFPVGVSQSEYLVEPKRGAAELTDYENEITFPRPKLLICWQYRPPWPEKVNRRYAWGDGKSLLESGSLGVQFKQGEALPVRAFLRQFALKKQIRLLFD